MVDLKPELTRMATPESNRPAPEADLAVPETEMTEAASETAAVEAPKEAVLPAATAEKTHRPRPASAQVVAPAQSELAKRVEKILEEGLSEPYHRLSPLAQQEFKLKGEQTAGKISELLKATNVKVKKVFQLIMEWLKMLPGINRFFLEQEAKIKTDRIIALHKKL